VNDDDDFPTDSCFTCGVSPTRAEARGYQQAITDLRQKGDDLRREGFFSADVGFRNAADYLEVIAKERTP
jgi:hypothetical protein